MLAYNLDWEMCHKIAARTCYSAGIIREDRKDFTQDVLVEMMERALQGEPSLRGDSVEPGRARRDSGELSSKEMWRAARCVRSRYWRAYKKRKGISSLNAPVRDTRVELSETIADDKALDLDALLDAKSCLEHLPPGIVRVGKKLAKENPLTKNQRLSLFRFRKGEVKPSRGIEIYYKLRAGGLCVWCGEESGNFARCPPCRERLREAQKKYRENKGKAWKKTLRDHWRKQWRCPRCGAFPEVGYKICPACLARNRKYLKAYRERRARGQE